MSWLGNLRQLVFAAALAAAGAATAEAPAPDAPPADPEAGSAPAPAPGSAVPATQAPEPFGEVDIPLPDPDLWQRIRLGFLLEPLDSPLVQEHEAWYASRPDYIRRFVDRGSLYLHHIVEEVEKRNMPTEIALLPVIESAFNPHAYSRSRASGIWQFIPSTGRLYGLDQGPWQDNRRDIVAATHAALNYLQRLYDMFGTWELALAAYNCGEGCVGRAIAANEKRGLPTDYLSLRLPSETTNYVPKLVAVKNIVLAPALYDIELASLPDKPYFTAVESPARIDVKLAAELANMSVEEFVALNPSHNKAVAVAPAPTGTLLLPLEKADLFRENLESWDKPLVSWNTIAGKKGESVAAIARRYGVSTAALKQVNRLQVNRSGRLSVAQPVLVPARAPAAPKVAASGPRETPARTGESPAAAKTKPPAGAAAPPFHTVRRGDTLYGIARRYDRALADLLRLNNLTAHATLTPGLRLRVR